MSAKTPRSTNKLSAAQQASARLFEPTVLAGLTQKCRVCGEILPLSDFYRDKRRPSGHRATCKKCVSVQSKEKYTGRTAEYNLWRWAQIRAGKNGREFTIKVSDIVIPEICPVFNIPIDTPSIDRIDPTKGYVPGNVRIISMRANMLKSDATLEEMGLIVADLARLRKAHLI